MNLQNKFPPLFVLLQYILPQHTLSRLVLKATRVKIGWFKDLLISSFLKLYPVNMQEATQSDPLRYATFNEFFTRALNKDARPVTADPHTIASPVDGTVSECGTLNFDQLLQAKNHAYSLADLLANQSWAKRFEGGTYATIYLAPYDYHRIHMPIRGQLRDTVYVPGRLFSVNGITAQYVPRLFARNERVLTLFDTAGGALSLVMVGALNVGSMTTVWAGDITPTQRKTVTRLPETQIDLEQGAELGRFNMGSTVILIFEKDRVRLSPDLTKGSLVRFGQVLGRLV